MKRSALAIIALVAFASSLGCYKPDNVSYKAITSNLSPEMATLSERQYDQHTNLAITDNLNLRMFNGDLGRVFYTNRSSTLSPYPIPNLSGVPE